MPEDPDDSASAPENIAETGATAEENSDAKAAEERPVSEEGGVLQPCPNCSGLLDVSDQEPFAQVHCPMCGTLMRARTQLKNFALTEVLGAGGMGAVYKARDVNLNRVVALKVVRREYSADAQYLAKFEREARITASVNHPHVVKVFSFGSDHGLFYIAMESVDKGSLDDLMNLQGRVAEAQVLEVGLQIAQGLQAAHKKGLIHRDVKPGNILFADAHTAKIVDFGLALLAEHEAEERGEVWGTPYYVAPEKLNQEPEDYRSDIYSLGGTLFHAVAGRPPFEAESASLVALKHIKSKAVSLQAFAPDVSSATAYVINRMLHKDPAQRYQTYDELLEHLNYARAQLLEAAEKPRKKTRVVVESAEQQHFIGAVMLAVLALMVVAGILAFVFRDRLFNKKETEMAAVSQVPQPITVRYEAARKQLLNGDFSVAQEALAELGQQPVPEPLRSWIIVHEAMAAFLGGRPEPARSAFKKLTSGEAPAAKAGEKQLAAFFAELGAQAANTEATPPDAAKKFDTRTFGAIAPFVFALKDWELGKFSEANQLFASFLASEPQGTSAWIADYRPLAEKYTGSFSAYEAANSGLKKAKTAEERAKVLASLDALKKAPGKMAEVGGALQRDTQKRFAELDEAEQKKAGETREKEAKQLADAKAKYNALCNVYRFDETAALFARLTLTESALAAERDALSKKAKWLTQFKGQLIVDINARGYPEPISKRTGVAMPGGVKKASAAQCEIQTPYGWIPVPWADLPPAMLFKMAEYFTKNETAPERVADRKWLAGVFAFGFGMTREGRGLLADAAQTKDEYREQLSMFIDSSQ